MRYIIANKKQAENVHISLIGHLVKGDEVMLNEKEVTACSLLSGDISERASQIGGKVYEYVSAMQIINEGGWQ
jgi:hypothetical protein